MIDSFHFLLLRGRRGETITDRPRTHYWSITFYNGVNARATYPDSSNSGAAR